MSFYKLVWAGATLLFFVQAQDIGLAKRPSYAQVVNGEVEAFFDERDYDDTRVDRGIELCANTTPVYKELWHGFSLLVPQTYPYNKQSIVAQHFCHGGCSSWCASIDIEDNQMYLDHRFACADSALTTAVLLEDIPRDTWHDFLINARFSLEGNGRYVVYLGGKVIHEVASIQLGFDGEWTSGDRMTNGVGFKNGQYNADASLYTNETRTLYFDNIAWYNVDDGQTDGYETVSK
ncbi:hypothetical protein S7711_11551 [Stachybotrys chartarum IBT 7711]|uniref:Alginate lyase 2 domain-containing protein n=1 Tax=Stachybotrys chartarum (strain CBS 109288 / IBT 7711) TaxID=1280523 RepID=A0A084ANE3_STACB|nr:hypothetical protein S7711_11551 [Stachybotrys chartarum IBT 7711]